MDDEWGTDGVDPDEQVRENASAHSYRRYVCCMVMMIVWLFYRGLV